MLYIYIVQFSEKKNSFSKVNVFEEFLSRRNGQILTFTEATDTSFRSIFYVPKVTYIEVLSPTKTQSFSITCSR